MAETSWKKVALSGDIVNNDINASAGIAQSKISGLTNSLNLKVPNTRTVNGYALTDNVALVKGDVGLGSVDNTLDLNKPISVATQSELDTKAPLASPVLTGTPTAPTPVPSDVSLKIATTAFVTNAVAGKNTLAEMNDVVIEEYILADNDIIAYDWEEEKYTNQSASEAGLAVSGHNHSGTYEPADSDIQTHVSNDTKHRLINDSGTTATVLFSASKIISELAGKEGTHSHPYLSNTHVASGVTSARISNWDGALTDISDIRTLLTSDDALLDELQEVVDYIKANRDDLDALSVANIYGLEDALGDKTSYISGVGAPSGVPTDGLGTFSVDTNTNDLWIYI